jgi:radical SAM-linked protein
MLNKRGVNMKHQHLETSLLEGVFSRGDHRLAPVIEKAWLKGCRFDGWTEKLDFSKWHNVMLEQGLDPFTWSERNFELGAPLPWDMIDSGISQDYLIKEFQRAIKEEFTPDCKSSCHGCGLACKSSPAQAIKESSLVSHLNDKAVSDNHHTLRLMYSKTGIVKYLSHRQTMTAFERAIRRAHILVRYSQGFHPHQKLSFGPALSMGVEGLQECFDIEVLTPKISVDYTNEIQKELNRTLPEGLEIIKVRQINKREISLSDFISRYEYEIRECTPYRAAIEEFMTCESSLVTRKGKTIDIRAMVEDAHIRDAILFLTLVDKENIKVRLYEILEKLLKAPLTAIRSLKIRRIKLFGFIEGWKEAFEL